MLPVIEYASEVWATGADTDVVYVFQVKYLKRVLKLRPQTPILAVLSEAGEYPVSVKLELRIVNNGLDWQIYYVSILQEKC